MPEGAYQRGSIRNVTFENISATDCYSYFKGREMPCVIWGKPDTPIAGIEFKNVSIIARGGHPVTDADVLPAENASASPATSAPFPPTHGIYDTSKTSVSPTANSGLKSPMADRPSSSTTGRRLS